MPITFQEFKATIVQRAKSVQWLVIISENIKDLIFLVHKNRNLKIALFILPQDAEQTNDEILTYLEDCGFDTRIVYLNQSALNSIITQAVRVPDKPTRTIIDN